MPQRPRRRLLVGAQGHRFGGRVGVIFGLHGFGPHAPVGVAAIAFDDFRRGTVVVPLPILGPSLLKLSRLLGLGTSTGGTTGSAASGVAVGVLAASSGAAALPRLNSLENMPRMLRHQE